MNKLIQRTKMVLLSTFVAATLTLFGTSVAQAFGVAFSYDGSGIRDWPSLSATHVNSNQTVRIVHNQNPDFNGGNKNLMVIIQRRNWAGAWDNITSQSYNGSVRGATFDRKLSSDGTYRLRFTSWDGAYTFHVWGTFNK